MIKRRMFDRQTKLDVVEAATGADDLATVAKNFNVDPKLVTRWLKIATEAGLGALHSSRGGPRKRRRKSKKSPTPGSTAVAVKEDISLIFDVNSLYQKIGKMQVELEQLRAEQP